MYNKRHIKTKTKTKLNSSRCIYSQHIACWNNVNQRKAVVHRLCTCTHTPIYIYLFVFFFLSLILSHSFRPFCVSFNTVVYMRFHRKFITIKFWNVTHANCPQNKNWFHPKYKEMKNKMCSFALSRILLCDLYVRRTLHFWHRLSWVFYAVSYFCCVAQHFHQ